MNISLLCTDQRHPILPDLRGWMQLCSQTGHAVVLVHDKAELVGGDLLFLVSCSQIITAQERSKYKNVLVLHASDLPEGRGWSPHVWAILGGADRITVSLIEAADPVDSGAIWMKTVFFLDGHELFDEINARLFEAELFLMTKAIENFGEIRPAEQGGSPGAYCVKRSPQDSRIDVNKSIAEQFELLRVTDPVRYPAFFEYRGQRYVIRIEKDNHVE